MLTNVKKVTFRDPESWYMSVWKVKEKLRKVEEKLNKVKTVTFGLARKVEKCKKSYFWSTKCYFWVLKK